MSDGAMQWFAERVTQQVWTDFGRGGHLRPDGIYLALAAVEPHLFHKELISAGILYYDTTHNQNLLRFTQTGYDLAKLLLV